MPCCGQEASLSHRPTSLWKALIRVKSLACLLGDSLFDLDILTDWPVQSTRKDVRIKKYAVALTAGVWQEGSWQILGTCTALAPGQASEAKGVGIWNFAPPSRCHWKTSSQHPQQSWMGSPQEGCCWEDCPRSVAQFAGRRVAARSKEVTPKHGCSS